MLCVENNLLSKSPFIGYKLTKQEVEIPFLTEDELKRIESKDFQNMRLNLVRDVFLFSCYAGLAYADVEKLTYAELHIEIDQEMWIFTN